LVIRTHFYEAPEDSFGGHPSPAGPFIRIVIEDSGRGISPENLNQIFDPFFSTKGTGEGTGLGLYIVSGILKKYGAQHHLESSEGCGTTFTVDFPLSESGKV